MENVDIYNKRRELTGVVKERHDVGVGEYRISAHIWIIDKDKLLIQQRVFTAKKFPGMWSQTGGGVGAGETSLETCIRECQEELGLTVKKDNITYVGSYTRVRDIVDIFLVEQVIDESKIVLQEEEVNEVKMVTFEEFDNMIAEGLVVPSINPSYEYFKTYVREFKGKE